MHEDLHNVERRTLPEGIGMKLWVECYAPGLRSVAEINEQLGKSYDPPLELTREEIQQELTKRAQTFGLQFNPEDITTDEER